jgi:hypothetical protein
MRMIMTISPRPLGVRAIGEGLRARDRGPVRVGGGVGISRRSGETVAGSTDIRRTGCSGVSAPLKDGRNDFRYIRHHPPANFDSCSKG